MTVSITTQPIPLTQDEDGVIHVAKTRVTLDMVIAAFLEGANAEEIAQQYPSLELADVYAVIGYYRGQRTEVDKYLQQRQQLADKVRRENEGRLDPLSIRVRLLARR
jgi:uncharacterized protein (DUF433 family)